MRLTILAATAATLAACSSGSKHGHDASVDAYPTALHAPYPQLPNQHGPILAQPSIVTITFANDTRAPTLEAFARWILNSQWLGAVGAEYGVMPGGTTATYHDPATPPTTMTSAQIESYLATGIANGTLPRPAALSSTLYIAYYPTTTTITATFVNGIMKTSCTDFGGYHSEAHLQGLDFSYAAIPNCPGAAVGLTADETTEMIVSHEVIEASTDAFPITAPAYQLRPDPTDPWFATLAFEVEDGDLCEAPERWVREAGFVAQRCWSNAAAAAGGDPCVPVDPTAPAFGATTMPTTVQTIAAGSSFDFAVDGWATGPLADWQLAAQTWSAQGNVTSRPRMTLYATTLNNGGTTMAHVVVPSTAASGSTASFLIVSTATGAAPGGASSMWPVAITVQ